MSTFDLRGLIHEVALTNPSADAHVVARAVLSRIDSNDRLAALTAAIDRLVIEELRTWRPNDAVVAAAPGIPKKLRASGIYMRRMALSVDQRNWKFLGDCSVADVRTLSDLRRTLSEQLAAAATNFAALADEMEQRSAAMVRDMPADLVRKYVR